MAWSEVSNNAAEQTIIVCNDHLRAVPAFIVDISQQLSVETLAYAIGKNCYLYFASLNAKKLA